MMKMVSVGVLALAISPSPLSAASASTPTADAVCMTSTRSKGGQFTIVVSSNRESEMAQRGFISRSCGELSGHIIEYRRKICEFSRSFSPALNERFLEDMGVVPTELCAMADELSGSH